MKDLTNQLCWKCAYSVPKRGAEIKCPWATEFKPVEGWTATVRHYGRDRWHDKAVTHTYDITKCPLFKREEARKHDVEC